MRSWSDRIYLAALCLIALSLPLSEFALSLGIILAVLNWLIIGDHRRQFRRLKQRSSLWWLMLVYLVHLAGMIYSADLAYGLHDLRIKLPLLFLPLVVGTSSPLSRKQFSMVLWFFIAGVFLGTLASLWTLTGSRVDGLSDIRESSVFISHIRFALLLNLAVFILAFETAGNRSAPGWVHLTRLVLLLWFVTWILVLKSLTGWVVLALVSLVFGLRWVFRMSALIPRLFVSMFILTVFLLSASVLVNSIARFTYTDELDPLQLEAVTASGNPYYHDPGNRQVENGHYTWIYISEKELAAGWNRISRIPYDSLDGKGQELRFTLIRYLSSLGLRKDSAGLAALRPEDIRAIEQGTTNVIFLNKWSLYPRLYELMWEIDVYLKGGNPSGHSVTQRLEYWKTALHIFQQHPFIGVGTGDVQQAFDRQYELDHSLLSPEWRLRAHNQYFTFLLTFGIAGFVIIFGSFAIFAWKEMKAWDPYSVAFLLIAGLSMLNEDTLETHTGVSFFAFFLSLFLLARNREYESV